MLYAAKFVSRLSFHVRFSVTSKRDRLELAGLEDKTLGRKWRFKAKRKSAEKKRENGDTLSRVITFRDKIIALAVSLEVDVIKGAQKHLENLYQCTFPVSVTKKNPWTEIMAVLPQRENTTNEDLSPQPSFKRRKSVRKKLVKRPSVVSPMKKLLAESETWTKSELELFSNLPTAKERVEFVYSILPHDATSLDR